MLRSGKKVNSNKKGKLYGSILENLFGKKIKRRKEMVHIIMFTPAIQYAAVIGLS